MLYFVAIFGAIVAGVLASITQPAFSFRRRSTSGLGLADPELLERYVRVISTEFVPRDERHPEGLDRAARYIAAEFRQYSGRVREQVFELGGVEYRNVIASFGPENGERIVVGAHYDADGPFPGADDNASGVAGLLELARLLSLEPPSGRIDLAAYSLEEVGDFQSGVYGSGVHARSLKDQGAKVKAMISLEMIGYFSDAPESQGYPIPGLRFIYPATGNFIAVVGKLDQPRLVRRIKHAMIGATRSLAVRSINAPTQLAGVTLSDHVNFWQAGYPAVMITDTAFYRNKAYHTAFDSWDRLDYDKMAEVIDGVFAAIQELS
ncbi:MAG TPA: M28 family peptidase [Blastocatellia bacterium]|nr:M28 family peptidase [Blastocatellia bacterium]